MANFAQYTTKQGDRWDQISQAAYGTPFQYVVIQEANKSVPLVPVLPGGIVLQVPIITQAETKVNNTSLPPWKR